MNAPHHDPLHHSAMSLRLEDHVLRVMENQMRLRDEVGECDWNLNMQTESLSFLVDDGHTVLAEVPAQIVGSHDESDDTWQWAWANPANQSFPRALRVANLIRRLAEETPDAPAYFRDPAEFRVPFPGFGSAMAVIGVGIAHGFAMFKCPFPGGAAYVAIDRFPAAMALPPDPDRIVRGIAAAVATFPFAHKPALETFLKRPGLDGTYFLPGTPRRLKVDFGPDGQIVHMDVVTPEGARPERGGGFFARLFGRRD